MAISKKVESPISIEEVKELYRTFNRRAFGGILTDDIPIKFSARLGRGGCYHFKCMMPNKKSRFNPYKGAFLVMGTEWIEICIRKDTTRERIIGILLHEMIHAYFTVKGMLDVEHGPPFLDMCKKVESITGHHVPLSEKSGMDSLEFHDTMIGVYVVKRGNRTTFATVGELAVKRFLADPEAMKAITGYDLRLPEKPVRTIYLCNTRPTQEMSVHIKAQRSLGYKTKLYSLRDPAKQAEFLDHVAEHGKVVLTF